IPLLIQKKTVADCAPGHTAISARGGVRKPRFSLVFCALGEIVQDEKKALRSDLRYPTKHRVHPGVNKASIGSLPRAQFAQHVIGKEKSHPAPATSPQPEIKRISTTNQPRGKAFYFFFRHSPDDSRTEERGLQVYPVYLVSV